VLSCAITATHTHTHAQPTNQPNKQTNERGPSLCPLLQVRYGRMSPDTQRLDYPAFRPCPAGRQLYISYGPVPNLKLLCYYGFCIPNNPHDLVLFQLEVRGGEGGGARVCARACTFLLTKASSSQHFAFSQAQHLSTRLNDAAVLLACHVATPPSLAPALTPTLILTPTLTPT
jgi:hypothetical protein